MENQWLVGTAIGLHRHECKCGRAWEHDGAEMHKVSDEEFIDAHTCGSCGTKVSECLMPLGCNNDVDPTEQARRARQQKLNSAAGGRASLEAQYGQVWDTAQLTAEFSVKAFAAPFVVVTRKADGQVGSLEFQHYPRFYFNYVPDNGRIA